MRHLKTFNSFESTEKLDINSIQKIHTMKYLKTQEEYSFSTINEISKETEELYKKYGIKSPDNDPFKFIGSVAGEVVKGVEDTWKKIVEWFTEWKAKIIQNWNSTWAKIEGYKDLLPKIWESICDKGRDKWNEVCNYLFQKNYDEVKLSDINFTNIKRVSSDIQDKLKEFFSDKTWSFKDDLEKLKGDPELAMKDKSLRLKTAINKVLTLVFSSFAVPAVHNIITQFLVGLVVKVLAGIGVAISGAAIGIIISVIVTIGITLLFMWLRKKQIKYEIKICDDLTNHPDIEVKSFIEKAKEGAGKGYSKLLNLVDKLNTERKKELEDTGGEAEAWRKKLFQAYLQSEQKHREEAMSQANTENKNPESVFAV